VVVAATPLDLAALIELRTPVVRARYEFADAGPPTLASVVEEFLARGAARATEATRAARGVTDA
jgi:predicted GTPase